MLSLLRILPKNQLSFVVGKIARLKYPRFFSQALIKWYVKRYQVNLSEVALALQQYSSLGEFFIRELKYGARPVGHGVVSPVDGRITEFGALDGACLLQVKGKTYDVAQLVGSKELGLRYHNGYFITFYLAPKDYHHIHAPIAGDIEMLLHIPGTLWPVNDWSLTRIDGLLTVNERVITVVNSTYGLVSVVKVGATNVGCISLSYDELRSNQHLGFFPRRRGIVCKEIKPPKHIECAERLGTFNLGSSVVLLFEKGRFSPGKNVIKGPIKYGVSLTER